MRGLRHDTDALGDFRSKLSYLRTLREISCVVASCSSIAAEIAVEVSSTFWITALISAMTPTDPLVTYWIAMICSLIHSVALLVWLARSLTSEAASAKPLSASPARADSIVALSARLPRKRISYSAVVNVAP